VPNELALPKLIARRWGERLFGFGGLSRLMGFLALWIPSLFQYLTPIIIMDGCALAVFAFFLIFLAPRVEYVGKPSEGGHH
jgi:hypothetical protein